MNQLKSAIQMKKGVENGECGMGKPAKFDLNTFGLPQRRHVIKDLNFTIHPGEKVALVGPTGAGKSSIIRLCAASTNPAGVAFL